MAKLGKPVPGFKLNLEVDTWQEYDARTDALLAKLIQQSSSGGLVGRVLRFPKGDGYAFYLVVKEVPLTLSHIPVGDAWTIPEAHIRGLRVQDVRDMIRRDDALAVLFSPQGLLCGVEAPSCLVKSKPRSREVRVSKQGTPEMGVKGLRR